jgi:hypothetical protein
MRITDPLFTIRGSNQNFYVSSVNGGDLIQALGEENDIDGFTKTGPDPAGITRRNYSKSDSNGASTISVVKCCGISVISSVNLPPLQTGQGYIIYPFGGNPAFSNTMDLRGNIIT